MTLSEYIKNFPRKERKKIRERIAHALSVSESYVRNMCNGNKLIPGKYAIQIEQITKGAVSRYITAPTFYPIEERE